MHDGRVWIAVQTRRERPEDSPAWVRNVIDNVEAPRRPGRSIHADLPEGHTSSAVGVLRYRAERFVTIDTAYGTNHLQFDRQGRLWTSGDSVALGMFDPNLFDPGKPRETAALPEGIRQHRPRGTVGGRRGLWHRRQPERRHGLADQHVHRSDRRARQPRDRRPEHHHQIRSREADLQELSAAAAGRSAIGIDVGADGRVWFGTASGHLGRFDPATERFTYWATPGPRRKRPQRKPERRLSLQRLRRSARHVRARRRNGDFDRRQFRCARRFRSATERFSIVRVPYPLVMYHRGIDGRIDDPRAGWKGRGLWINDSNDPARFIEHGMGVVSHIQLRPHPLVY